MSERYPSGTYHPTGTTDESGYAPYGTVVQDASQAHQQYYAADPYGQAAAYDSGQFDTTAWDHTPAHGTPAYPAADVYAGGGYEGYGTDWDSGGYPVAPAQAAHIPAQANPAEWETGGEHGSTEWGSGPYPVAAEPVATVDYAGYADHGVPQEYPHYADHAGYEAAPENTASAPDEPPAVPAYAEPDYAEPAAGAHGADAVPPFAAPVRVGRRRPKPRRSALLSVAAPSLCVLGVTAVATAAVHDADGAAQSEDDSAPLADGGDSEPVRQLAANQQFDTQLATLTQAADDYADRASRTQGRLDLQEAKAEEERLAEEEAARIEAARQKFFIPVDNPGLSARYGQIGVNWMINHTGIDFPVRYGTPVRAATDGTVRTQWHSSYGNLMIITAPDGTETWYAHLSSFQYTSGYVQAGTVVAYVGSTGNSTGPHLHFEVRPAGGGTVDPEAWLRTKGLSPS